jgi:uncharacterized membrane protein YozB (DUF420 family)
MFSESFLNILPSLNAALNASAAALLVVGYALVRRGRFRAHGWTMATACLCSGLFLVGYLTLHANRPPRSFAVQGSIRPVYFAILLTHTLLAAVIVPMIVGVLVMAIKRRWPRHRTIARYTLPLWLYVSLTGVVIYWMLYHLHG